MGGKYTKYFTKTSQNRLARLYNLTIFIYWHQRKYPNELCDEIDLFTSACTSRHYNPSCYYARADSYTYAYARADSYTYAYAPADSYARADSYAQACANANARTWTYNHQRTRALDNYLRRYNTQRGHSALGGRPPVSRLA